MKEGIEAYIIESNLKVRKVTVAHVTGKYKTEAKKPPHNYLNGQLL